MLVVNEVEELECNDERNDFTSQLTFQFSALDSATLDDINDFGEFMADLYNDVVESYWDPQIRRLDSLEANDFTRVLNGRRLQSGCKHFQVIFSVTGTCRGCEDRTPILDGEGSQRARLSSVAVPRRRRLKKLENCDVICDGNPIAKRAPTLEEFSEQLLGVLPDSTIPNICGLPVSDVFCATLPDGDEISFTQVIALELGTGVSLAELNLVQLENGKSFYPRATELVKRKILKRIRS